MLQHYLSSVRSTRRAQARKYDTGSVLLLAILAMSSGCVSYRKIHEFISIKFSYLKKLLNLNWDKPPVYNSLRYILISIDSDSLEEAFRKYSNYLQKQKKLSSLQKEKSDEDDLPSYLKDYQILSVDGKSLRGSFDNMQDQKMKQILSIFDTKQKLILAHKEIDEKTNEIPEFQNLLKELNLNKSIFTLDALHTQKKL